jgi:O-antigen/teichoic acid export membrane protein
MFQSAYSWIRRLFHRLFQNELTRRVVKNSGYLFSATGLSAGLSMLQGILVARLLGVENYGILGAIIMFTSLVNKLVSFRMGELVIKFVAQYSEAGDQKRAATLFKTAALVEMGASILAFVLICALSPLAARFLAKDPNTTAWFILYGLIVLANLVSESSMGLLQIFDRFRNVAVLSLVQSIVTLALVTIVYLSDGGMVGVLLSYLVGKAVGAIALSAGAVLEASHHWGNGWWRSPVSLLKPQWRELGHFAVNTNISASLSLINKDSELLWVSFFRGPVETGYYKLALSLANIIQLPISPLPQATYPELTRQAARRSWDDVRSVLRQGSILAASYTLPAMLALGFFGRPLISLLYKPEYLPAYQALLILLVGFLFANIFYWRRNALLALGRPDFPAKLNVILAVLKVIGILLLVPQYGYLASAALLSAFYITSSLISFIKIRTLLAERSLVTGQAQG